MLKPYIFVACEKVILDHEQNQVPSLISLFNKLQISLAADAPEPPPNAVAPKDWAVYSSWDSDPTDVGKPLFLNLEILLPDKSRFGEIAKIPLKIEPNQRSQSIIRIPGFPVGQPGLVTVRTWLEEDGKVVFEPIEFILIVEHIKLPVAPKPQPQVN